MQATKADPEKRRQTSARLAGSLIDAAKDQAWRERRPYGDLIASALRLYLEAKRGPLEEHSRATRPA